MLAGPTNEQTHNRVAVSAHARVNPFEIADDSSNDWIEREGPDGKKYREFNSDNFRRCKLRIAAREWLLSKLLPKRYSWDWFLDDKA